MELTFVTDLGQSFVIEIDPGMELENVMALLEAESGIPVAEQSISYNGKDLSAPKSTLRELGVTENNAMLLLRRKIPNMAGTGRPVEQDSEMMRLQLLGDPDLMRQLRETQPELAAAVQSNPARFAELLRQTRERQSEAELQRQREIQRLNADPFDVEAQRRIEEAIRQQAVMENMEHALEYSPESFGRVTMLYVNVEVNGKPVKAFVDSGAQQTIMSPECAESCNIMRLLDTRFSGIARGVGTAKILGRVHSAQFKLADLHLPCSITIMEGRDVDLLLGLDMLKAHQACIDLEKNVLRVRGREVRFLSEHELPEKAKELFSPDEAQSSSGPSTGSVPGRAPSAPASFPGGGNTIGSAPRASQPSRPPAPAASRHPESSIRTLMDLGATREVAISSLDAAGGNIDVAASLLF
ncbi:DNA damage-inducible v-SNARE binding protein [Mycena indigotica]|uniref:DNA damage-inducible protein 1 n=1 Tax=Mycena indigotica TaxID=2126181 RepID=A0A8H6SQU8_9AGAR|nr:DNA damage-inducible v-SNARE binding protein [Mycena indigotica]KAF7302275.1 DNA damage-inducible v-SNARE binding protein [Mycena indigotica]